jgi:hypothetical protein
VQRAEQNGWNSCLDGLPQMGQGAGRSGTTLSLAMGR